MASDDSRAILAQAYERYAAGLYRYALMILVDHGLAEDAVQQAFMRTMTTGKRTSAIASLNGYLIRAVRNECYSMLKKQRRHGQIVKLLSSRPLLEKVDEGGAGEAEREALEAAIRRLPPEQREVLHMKVYEGRTFREIAEVTDVSVNTAASRYRYAINALRDTCLERGSEETGS
jgi:RNA polymerase sigma-70 factor (ECF subfamily)